MKPLFYLGLLAAGVLLYLVGHADGRGQDDGTALDRQTFEAIGKEHRATLRLVATRAASAALTAKLITIGYKRDLERSRADSAARLAGRAQLELDSARSAADSLRIYPPLVEQLTLRGDHLEAALARSNAHDSLTWVDRERWKANAEADIPAMEALHLALLAEHAARRCKIAGLVPCPSRKTSVAIGAVGGLVLGAAIAH